MIILSLGSNLSSKFGNRFNNLEKTMTLLVEEGLTIHKKSSFYETPSYPDPNNPKFINMVISIRSDLSAKSLMLLLISIEEKMERKRFKKNSPRTCDIDIIDFNNKVLNFSFNTLNLTIPHQSLTFRNFVLFPLKEISPNWKHPKTNESIDALIKNLPDDDRNSILKIQKN
jgi:2-amino-4-hydroxy-6-hydroxymethyldihydropteridine diphosphokinase